MARASDFSNVTFDVPEPGPPFLVAGLLRAGEVGLIRGRRPHERLRFGIAIASAIATRSSFAGRALARGSALIVGGSDLDAEKSIAAAASVNGAGERRLAHMKVSGGVNIDTVERIARAVLAINETVPRPSLMVFGASVDGEALRSLLTRTGAAVLLLADLAPKSERTHVEFDVGQGTFARGGVNGPIRAE